MKKATSSICAWGIACLLILYACKSATGGGDPKTVLLSFFQAVSQKDVDGAAKFATQDSKGTLDMMKMGFELEKNLPDSVMQHKQHQYDLADIVFGEPKISGDIATIPISSKTQQHPPIDIRLLKENGQWKVDFSMSSLMSMGKKVAAAVKDTADSNIQVNAQQIEQSMKMADSVLKHMDPQKMEEIRKQLEKMKR